jgi:hypothetical protein
MDRAGRYPHSGVGEGITHGKAGEPSKAPPASFRARQPCEAASIGISEAQHTGCSIARFHVRGPIFKADVMYNSSPFDDVTDTSNQVPDSAAPNLKLIRHVSDHLVLLFGRAVKSDLQKISLTAVSADGFYLSSDIPVIFIRKSDRRPLCLGEFAKHFGDLPVPDDDAAILDYMCATLKSHNPNMTRYEGLFLDLYFGMLKALLLRAQPKSFGQSLEACRRLGVEWDDLGQYQTPNDIWRALLPIPEMQIYVRDPLGMNKAIHPDCNFRFDYGFWNGTRLIAVEIDGAEPSGYARDIRRDRLLRKAGIEPIHILNVELAKHRGRALQALLHRKFFGHGWDFDGKRPATEIPF